jgi:hypothetical protein
MRFSRVACVLAFAALPLSAAAPSEGERDFETYKLYGYGRHPAVVAKFARSDSPPRDPAPAPAPAVTIDLGAPVTVEVGRKCILSAETTAKKVTWKVPAGCDAYALDGKRIAVWAPPGTYVFAAMAPAGDDVITAEVVLTVTGARPPPSPVPPDPVAPLAAALQAAYTPEADAARLKTLAELMGSVVAAAKASGAVTTTKQLQEKVHQATDLAVGVGKLPATRRAVGEYLVTKLGNASQPMTEAAWATAAAEYANVAAALKQVK